MSILKFLKQKDPIPDHNAGLMELLGPEALKEANENVRRVLSEDTKSPSPSRGKYSVYSPSDRAEIGKFCAEHGSAKTLRKFKDRFPDLKESTARYMRGKYHTEIKSRKRKLEFNDDQNIDVIEIQPKKRGRPLLIGNELDSKVQSYVNVLRKNTSVINVAIILSAARGIVMKTDKHLLTEFGGHIELSKHWAKSLLARMNFVKRRGSTACKTEIENFPELKENFLCRIRQAVSEDDIPPQLVINWDHAGLNVIPVSNWTMDVKGAKRVEITGLGDKRQITAVFAGSLTGKICYACCFVLLVILLIVS